SIDIEDTSNTGNSKVKLKTMQLGKWWLHNADRREYQTTIFDPSSPPTNVGDGSKYYNLWQDFAVEAKKGSWKLTKKHIWMVFCNKDKKKFKYVMRWPAWLVQNPGSRAESVLIFRGKRGAGKGFLFTQLVRLFGRHGLVISNSEHLTGK